MSIFASDEISFEKLPPLIDINHDTGDLVLSLQKDRDAKQVDAEFRVHRSIISLHSPVFRDLIESANPNEYVHGRPVVPCYGDSAEDFSALLMALYNGLALLQDKQLTLDAALAILRLTDKYQMEALHCGITRILLEYWPLNYEDYVARQKQLGSPGFRVLDSMKLIKSSQQCKVWELLPTAFYEVAARQEDWSDIERSSFEEYLSHQDLFQILKGRERAAKRLLPLCRWQQVDSVWILPLPWNPDNSVGPDSFLARREEMGLRVCRKSIFPEEDICLNIQSALANLIGVQLLEGKSPLNLLGDLKPADFQAEGVCAPCVDLVFQCILENKKRELWHNIPVDFDLPTVDPKLYSERMFRTL